MEKFLSRYIDIKTTDSRFETPVTALDLLEATERCHLFLSEEAEYMSSSRCPSSASDSSSINEFTGTMNYIVSGLSDEDHPIIVRSCVRLMRILLDHDTLHAIMRLLLRLTRIFSNAKIFAQEGGVCILIELTQTCGYVGFSTLATLLIRHVMEEPTTLALAMQNVIYSRTLSAIPPGYKELVYLTRQISAAVSREPNTFFNVAKCCLRIDITVLRKNAAKDDDRLLLKSIKNETQPKNIMSDLISYVTVQDLLNCLIKRDKDDEEGPTPTTTTTIVKKILKKSPNQEKFDEHQALLKKNLEETREMKKKENQREFILFHLEIQRKIPMRKKRRILHGDEEEKFLNPETFLHDEQFNQIHLDHQIKEMEMKILNNLIETSNGTNQLIDLTDSLNLEMEIFDEKIQLRSKNLEIYEKSEREFFAKHLQPLCEKQPKKITDCVPDGKYTTSAQQQEMVLFQLEQKKFRKREKQHFIDQQEQYRLHCAYRRSIDENDDEDHLSQQKLFLDQQKVFLAKESQFYELRCKFVEKQNEFIKQQRELKTGDEDLVQQQQQLREFFFFFLILLPLFSL